MRTYPLLERLATLPGARPLARALAASAGLLLLFTAPLSAQRRYLVEASVAPAYASYDGKTELKSALGALLRVGVWLPLNFEIEVEGSYAKPQTTAIAFPVKVKSIGASLLYNIPVGRVSSAYLKGGVGSTTYGGNCPPVSVPNTGPCGSTSVLVGGAGFRAGITETIMARAEGAINHSTKLSLTNVGLSLGLSAMFGSTRILDSDKDGVLDSKDRCPNTPLGALVDRRGCPTDSDQDGVADGVDRCPGTSPGAKVDEVGCPLDTDKDGVPDGLDKCPNTAAGAAVDESGCPRDSDKDGVADGIDRCPDTPAGAAVDQLGCPGDSDGDGVLDGLDKCPNTPPGTRVNAFGCPPGESGAPQKQGEPQQQPPPSAKPNIDPGRAPGPPPVRVPPNPGPGATLTAPVVLHGVTFASGSARITPQSQPVLDSVARVLLANPSLRVEIAGHTDNSGTPAANQHLSQLRAEAVRTYLISHGVPFQWLTAKGYGATQPLTSATSPAARAQNRRVELRPQAPSP
jgi:outer membrane protein OmpA-like peptidoglycan-associated protein